MVDKKHFGTLTFRMWRFQTMFHWMTAEVWCLRFCESRAKARMSRTVFKFKVSPTSLFPRCRLSTLQNPDPLMSELFARMIFLSMSCNVPLWTCTFFLPSHLHSVPGHNSHRDAHKWQEVGTFFPVLDIEECLTGICILRLYLVKCSASATSRWWVENRRDVGDEDAFSQKHKTYSRHKDIFIWVIKKCLGAG